MSFLRIWSTRRWWATRPLPLRCSGSIYSSIWSAYAKVVWALGESAGDRRYGEPVNVMDEAIRFFYYFLIKFILLATLDTVPVLLDLIHFNKIYSAGCFLHHSCHRVINIFCYTQISDPSYYCACRKVCMRLYLHLLHRRKTLRRTLLVERGWRGARWEGGRG